MIGAHLHEGATVPASGILDRPRKDSQLEARLA